MVFKRICIGVCVEQFLVAAKFKSLRRWCWFIIWSRRVVNTFVKHFFNGSMREISRTWSSVKSQEDFFGMRKRFEVFHSSGILWKRRHFERKRRIILWLLGLSILMCS